MLDQGGGWEIMPIVREKIPGVKVYVFWSSSAGSLYATLGM